MPILRKTWDHQAQGRSRLPPLRPARQSARQVTITYHNDLTQGSEEWHAARCGLLTASEMHLIVTDTLKIAANTKERAHLYELMGQRITKYVEPRYISDDMLRGQADEIVARALYAERYAPVDQAGFITNDKWGFTLGYSPDGLVGKDGQIECKSRCQKLQIEMLVEHVPNNTIPAENRIQVQTGLLVSGRKWCDFVSYCGGLPMATIRVFPDKAVRDAIIAGSLSFEERMAEKMAVYEGVLWSTARLIPTERRPEEEDII